MKYLCILILLYCLPAYATRIETTIYISGEYLYRNALNTMYTGDFISNPIVITSLLEDINRDNEVDFADINIVRKAYGSFPNDTNWDARCDFDKNGEIDFSDINVVRAAYGETLSEY